VLHEHGRRAACLYSIYTWILLWYLCAPKVTCSLSRGAGASAAGAPPGQARTRDRNENGNPCRGLNCARGILGLFRPQTPGDGPESRGEPRAPGDRPHPVFSKTAKASRHNPRSIPELFPWGHDCLILPHILRQYVCSASALPASKGRPTFLTGGCHSRYGGAYLVGILKSQRPARVETGHHYERRPEA